MRHASSLAVQWNDEVNFGIFKRTRQDMMINFRKFLSITDVARQLTTGPSKEVGHWTGSLPGGRTVTGSLMHDCLNSCTAGPGEGAGRVLKHGDV